MQGLIFEMTHSERFLQIAQRVVLERKLATAIPIESFRIDVGEDGKLAVAVNGIPYAKFDLVEGAQLLTDD